VAGKNRHFGQRLQRLLDDREWSDSELARRINRKSGTISPYLTKERVPEWDVLVDIALVLDVDIHWLLTGEHFSVDETVLHGVNSIDVTQDELEAFEKRLMDCIEARFKRLEERITQLEKKDDPNEIQKSTQ